MRPWGQPKLTMPLIYTRMQEDTTALVGHSVTLYYIYNSGEYVTVVNNEKNVLNIITLLADCAVYQVDLVNHTSERIL